MPRSARHSGSHVTSYISSVATGCAKMAQPESWICSADRIRRQASWPGTSSRRQIANTLNVLDDRPPELARRHLRRAGHLPLEVVRDFLLRDRLRDRCFDCLRGLEPAQVTEHH